MNRIQSFSLSATLVLLTSPAFAAITADDVWANNIAYMQSTGAQLSGVPMRDGAVLHVAGVVVTFDLPMGLGSVFFQSSDLILTENGDGTVSLDLAPETQVSFGGTATVDGETISVSADATIRLTNYTGMASGTSGDITYVTQVDMIDIALDSFDFPNKVDFPSFAVNAFLTIRDVASTTRIAVADTVTLTSDGTSGATIYDVSYSDGSDISGAFVGAVESTATTTTVVLPGTPMDIMNLAAAFRDGLSFDFATTAISSQSQTVQTLFDGVTSDQFQQVDRTSQTLQLGRDGFAVASNSTGIMINIASDPMIPFPIKLQAAQGNVALSMPIMASPDLAPISLSVDLRDVTASDDLWALVDPGRVLSRDPATMAFAISGQVRNSVDLFDFMALADMGQQINNGKFPVELHSLDITGLDLRVVGASVTGDGAFTFDNSDLATYDGLPRPVGTGSVIVTGTNALITKLADIGLLSAEDVMGARMGMGMFGKATGEDQLTATLDMTADGQVIVNGQPLP